MRLYKVLFISIAILTIACTDNNKDKTGGKINLYEVEAYRSLFPHNAIDAIGVKVVNQIFEGLVKFNEHTLEIEPAIAASWEISNENTTYTFKLKEDIKFHPNQIFESDDQRKLTADDVIFSFKLLCTHGNNNNGFHTTFKDLVKGATEHYIMSVNDEFDGNLKGITKIDNYTIQIDLEHPSPYFLYSLALPFCAIIPEIGYKYYKESVLIGTGPFQVIDKDLDQITLEKNQDFYRKDKKGRKLPYLDQITFHFNKSVTDQIVAFANEDIDILYKMNEEKYINKYTELNLNSSINLNNLSTPYMAVSYCGFNLQDSILKNKQLRQAINYAIDVSAIRTAIAAAKENEDAKVSGITPTAFEKYNTSEIETYAIDVDKAKALLVEAGYPNGEGIDTIELDINKGRGNNLIIAENIQTQLKENLNIDVKVNVMPFSDKIDKSKSGASSFFKAGWIADYPHPQNFLSLFYGRDVPGKEEDWDSYPNTTRYKNPEFDKLYEKAMRVPLAETYAYLQEAEKILMDDAPAIILWYGKNQILTNAKVQNYPMNVMGYIDYSKVWLKK